MRLLFPLVVLLAAPLATAQTDDFCENVTELNSVFFAFDSNALEDETRARLDENLEVLERCPEYGVVIEGWSDGVESNERGASLQRAQAVHDHYVERGLDAARLAVQGGGEYPGTNADSDPGPGDANARRVDSQPVALGDLPTAVPEADPEPFRYRIRSSDALSAQLLLDWSPAAPEAGCPEGALALEAATLEIYDRTHGYDERTISLDTTCLRADPPGDAPAQRWFAWAAEGVYVLEGRMGYGDASYPTGWIVGPDGQRRTDGRFCAAYEPLGAAMDDALGALVSARAEAEQAPSEARTVRVEAAEEALGQALDAVRPFLETVAEVGGRVPGARLACANLPPYDEHSH